MSYKKWLVHKFSYWWCSEIQDGCCCKLNLKSDSMGNSFTNGTKMWHLKTKSEVWVFDLQHINTIQCTCICKEESNDIHVLI
jgi:hypothetical protein